MGARSPDPVADPARYQQQLIALVGEDDPAAVQQATTPALRAAVAEAGGDLRRRPAVTEWSAMELIGHLTDAELVVSGRYRWVLAQERPPLPGYDQDRWVASLHHNDDHPDELLALFEALRSANLALWRRTPARDRQRVGLHAERGEESFALMFRLMAGHDRFHLTQIRETLAAVRSGGGVGSVRGG